MMRRLRDEIESDDPTLARAAALLASRPPLDTDRTWPRELPPMEPVRRVRPPLRMALVLAISLASVVAVARTALPRGNWWAAPWTVVHGLTGTGTAPDVSRRAPARPVAAHGTSASGAIEAPASPLPAAGPAGPAPSIPGLAAQGPAAESAPAAAPASSAALGRGVAANRGPAAGRTNEPGRSGADGESALMLDAVRALRRDRDPARALTLAETALDRYPHGAQVEEATAIGMEAASAAGDSATARKLAERYLASYREGRFADRALQIVAASSR